MTSFFAGLEPPAGRLSPAAAGLYDAVESRQLPDFFILGAPKCGTTALYTYLQQHPATFMAARYGGRKIEPQFFCEDFPGIAQVSNRDDYLDLFKPAPAGALRGESSAWYLFSQVACRRIIEQAPQAKMIVMLRNPVDMVQSLHNQMVYSLREDVHDLELAWQLQDERRTGRLVPRHCREPAHLQYREVCSFAHQLERLFESVPRRQVKIVLLEEMLADHRATYLAILEFLGLPDDGRTHFPQVNRRSVYRNRAIVDALNRLPRGMDPLIYGAKAVANRSGFRLLRLLKKTNAKRERPPPLKPAFRNHLASVFRNDIRATERVLGRSLDPWWERLKAG
jgi:hypothetical protein